MNRFEILDLAGVEAIHQATLRILSETGVQLSHSSGRELLISAGARVENERTDTLYPIRPSLSRVQGYKQR